MEIDCDDEGNIETETALKSEPGTACYDEVWENDDGKTSVSSCNRFKRRYRHALEKPKVKAEVKVKVKAEVKVKAKVKVKVKAKAKV